MIDSGLIIELSTRLRKPVVMGVYILSFIDRVVYVGSSIDVHLRMKDHRRNSKLLYNMYYVIPCGSKEEMTCLEKEYIKYLKPRYNIKHNPIADKDLKLATMLCEVNNEKIPNNRTRAWVEDVLNRNDIKSVLVDVNPKTNN